MGWASTHLIWQRCIRITNPACFALTSYYRHFCENGDVAAAQGWDMLKPLREEIEACYCNGYLTNIALAWGKFVDEELPERWAINGIQNQYTFFDRQVRPWLDEAKNRRGFVIISDALRYEAAEELTGYLNGTYRVEAKLSSQLGIFALLYRPWAWRVSCRTRNSNIRRTRGSLSTGCRRDPSNSATRS